MSTLQPQVFAIPANLPTLQRLTWYFAITMPQLVIFTNLLIYQRYFL